MKRSPLVGHKVPCSRPCCLGTRPKKNRRKLVTNLRSSIIRNISNLMPLHRSRMLVRDGKDAARWQSRYAVYDADNSLAFFEKSTGAMLVVVWHAHALVFQQFNTEGYKRLHQRRVLTRVAHYLHFGD